MPPPTGQQQLPRELIGAIPVPAVDALAVVEQAVTRTVTQAVPAVPGRPDLGHVPLHEGSRRLALTLVRAVSPPSITLGACRGGGVPLQPRSNPSATELPLSPRMLINADENNRALPKIDGYVIPRVATQQPVVVPKVGRDRIAPLIATLPP
jgi:hypothetical protein